MHFLMRNARCSASVEMAHDMLLLVWRLKRAPIGYQRLCSSSDPYSEQWHEAAPIKCAGKESAGIPALSHTERVRKCR